MSYSAVGLAGEVGECSCGAGELVVEPDAGGQGEEFGGDAGSEAVEGASVVAFQAELVFEGPEDRLDALPDGGEMRSAAGLVLAAGSQDQSAEALRHGGLELFAAVALVGDDRLSAAQPDGQHPQRDVAFAMVSRRQDRRSGGAVGGGQQVQSHPPKPPAVAAAVPIAARVGQLRTPDSLNRSSALHRRGVQQDQVIVIARALVGEDADQPFDRLREPLAALPVAGLLREFGEQVPQTLGRSGQEVGVMADVQHRLSDRQGDDLRVGHSSSSVLLSFGQEIVSGAEHRYEQPVEVGEHRGPPGSTALLSTADFDPAANNPYSTALPAVESII